MVRALGRRRESAVGLQCSPRWCCRNLCLAVVVLHTIAWNLAPTQEEEPGHRKSRNILTPEEAQSTRPSIAVEEQDPPTLNRLKHVGSFGLGHRFSKLSASVDLARQLDVPIVQVEWKDCSIDLFANLFGNSTLLLRPPHRGDQQSKTILVRNDVAGYYAGQAYKNAQTAVTSHHRSIWLQKLENDHTLYSQLLSNLPGRDTTMRAFQDSCGWHNRSMVIGVHVRAGNGETDHFKAAQRDQTDLDPATVAVQIQGLLAATNNPLVFVATDTASWVERLKSALHGVVDVVAYPQERVAPGEGVGYQHWSQADESCVLGWRSATMDMALLAETDTLVAVTRSTFTQIAPALLVLHKDGGRFCEMGSTAPVALECFSTVASWLFGQRQEAHKLMVHLADVGSSYQDDRFRAAKMFLSSQEPTTLEDRLYYYGPKFNKKYRGKVPFQTNWNLEG